MGEIAVPYEDSDRLQQFAREYVRTGSVITAIQRAGVQNPAFRMSVWGERLLARADVAGWVADEMEAEAARGPKVFTREVLTEDFQEIYERAMSEGEFTPAVSAKKAQAELLGLMDKNVNVTFTTKGEEMSMEAVEKQLAMLVDEGVVTLEQNEDGSYG